MIVAIHTGAAEPAASTELDPIPDWNEVAAALRDPGTRLAMCARCAEQGHVWEPVVVFRGGFPGPVHRHSYFVCAWCEERR